MTHSNSLTLEKWLDMLPPKPIPAQEKVLWVTKFAQPFKIQADIWRHHFKGYAGCKVTPGNTPLKVAYLICVLLNQLGLLDIMRPLST